MSIRYRLILYLFIGLLPLLFLSVYTYRQVYRARIQQVLLGHMATARANAGAVGEFIESIVRVQEAISLIIERRELSNEEISDLFAAEQREFPVLETLGYASSSGKIVVGQPGWFQGFNLAGQQYFREVAAGRDWIVSPLITIPPTDKVGFVIIHRMEYEGKFIGVMASVISPEALERFVTARVDPDIGYGILDSSGHIIVSTVLPKQLIPKHRDRSWIPSVQRALRGESAFAEPFYDRADGVERMGASVPVPEIGWVVNIFEPVSTAIAPVRRALIDDLLIDFLITIALLILAWLVGTRLANPIISLARKADAVAQGDFSQRMETWDQAELGTLAHAFNNMTTELELSTTEQRKAQELSLFLASIGELITSTLDPNNMLQAVAKKTAEFMGDAVVIYRLETSGVLNPVAIHASDPEVQQLARRILLAERPIKIGSGVAGKAVQVNQTIFVPRVSELEDPEMRFYLEKGNAISSIAVPMRVHDKIVGVFSVSSIRTPLVEDQVLVAEEIARRLGLALENIRLYEEALEREEFQKSLAELAGAASSTLEPETVLNEICGRTLELLNADGVYIWLLEEDEDRLVGESACGFKADVFIRASLPMTEKGTAAVQSLLRREGFYINDIAHSSDKGQRLTEIFHTQSAIFQPLISAGKPLGVMVITDTHNPNRFNDQDLERAELLAGYAATALANASEYARERRIAETLQRGLLPEIPSNVDRFELAHFYTPAKREAAIGGDFYDFIEVGENHYGLVTGDVSGKGLEAAVVTAMAKYIIRAYTVVDPEPPVVLEKTNNAIVKYTEPELFITLVYGILDTHTSKFRYGSAGHEPLLLYQAKERKVSFQTPEGMAAGLVKDQEYLTSECTLAPGDMLMLYTDGLTDARSPDGGFLEQDGLAKLVLETAGVPASEFLHALMNRVKQFTGGEFADDVAILVVRHS